MVPLETVDKADSSCPVNVEDGCTIKKVKLPKLVNFPQYRGLFVGLINKQEPIIIDNPNTHFFTVQTRFGDKFTRAYLIHDVLYVVTKDDHDYLEYINVRGVFEDPDKVMNWSAPGCDPTPCTSDDDEYPMPSEMYEIVMRKIFSLELQLGLQTVNDIINNNQLDSDEQRFGLQDRPV